ncbi:MAG: ABC transporter permease [Coriobacteriales bacterium]|nr:ABC transporter permease [Coriobacteriales bacterium]
MSGLLERFFGRFQHDWFILTSLVSKDFKLKYRRSVLGIAWSVLNPLLMMFVMAAVFTFVFRGNATTQPFPVYLILGTTLFNLMNSSTTNGASSIINSAGLIKKIRINKMIFPLQKVVFELVSFALSLIAVVIVLVVYRIMPTFNLLLLPLLLVYMLLFCAGLSLLLSALAVFFTDIIYLWGVIIVAWTYGTPLFYPINALPPVMLTVMQFNPMYHYVTYFRSITMCSVRPRVSELLSCIGQQQLWQPAWQPPGLIENLVCFGIAIITFGIGMAVFRATEKRFVLFV